MKKSHTEEKVGLKLKELPKMWGFPFNIFAMAEIAMDVPSERYYIEKLQISM